MAETAIKTARDAQMDADSRIADTAALAEGESEAFRAEYPTRLKFPYRLEDKAHKWPFLVEGMWHDGQFTYLRSNAQESPALYEEKDGMHPCHKPVWRFQLRTILPSSPKKPATRNL